MVKVTTPFTLLALVVRVRRCCCVCVSLRIIASHHYSLAHKVLQHRALARTLATDDGDLRQIELHVHAALCERILQLVDQRYQLLHAPIARRRHGVWYALLTLSLSGLCVV